MSYSFQIMVTSQTFSLQRRQRQVVNEKGSASAANPFDLVGYGDVVLTSKPCLPV